MAQSARGFDASHADDLTQIPNSQNRRNRQTQIIENGHFGAPARGAAKSVARVEIYRENASWQIGQTSPYGGPKQPTRSRRAIEPSDGDRRFRLQRGRRRRRIGTLRGLGKPDKDSGESDAWRNHAEMRMFAGPRKRFQQARPRGFGHCECVAGRCLPACRPQDLSRRSVWSAELTKPVAAAGPTGGPPWYRGLDSRTFCTLQRDESAIFAKVDLVSWTIHLASHTNSQGGKRTVRRRPIRRASRTVLFSAPRWATPGI